MKITIIAIGTRGDVQPYVALGLGLQGAGHRVRLAACANFKEFVSDRGLDFFPIRCDPREWLESDAGRDWLKSSRNPIKFIRGLTHLMQPSMERSLADSWTASQGADAIIYSLLAIGGYHIAEKLRVPSFAALIHPARRTRAFPSIAIHEKFSLGGYFNLLTHVAAEQLFWHPFRRLINKWRGQTLGLPPAHFFGPWGQMVKQKSPYLFGYSPSVVPKPRDWGEWLHVTGYWFLERPSDWEPAEDLLNFLDSGPPPVYVGFGSTVESDPEVLTDVVPKSLLISGCRGILLDESTGLGGVDLPDSVFTVDSIPHDWLFPRMAAVVHHGGAGTTASGFRAGIPNIVIASQAEMYFWGRRVAALRVGPESLLRRELSAERLATAISLATGDPGIRERAAALGKRIRAEDGVANAVKAFQERLLLLMAYCPSDHCFEYSFKI
jgi:sterol 3beta-glucosyltransferase